MPRYYFDVRDGDRLTPDRDGTELDGVEAARHEAIRTLAEIAKALLPGAVHRELTIEIRNETPEPLIRAALVFDVQRLR